MDESTFRQLLKDQMKVFNQKIDTLIKEVQTINQRSNQEEGIEQRAAGIPEFKGGNPFSRLIQMKSVAEYQFEFEKLMHQMTGIKEALLILFYTSGLKPAIQLELLIAKPQTLEEAFGLACMYQAHTEDIGSTASIVKPTWGSTSNTTTGRPLAIKNAQPVTKPIPSGPTLLLPPLLPSPVIVKTIYNIVTKPNQSLPIFSTRNTSSAIPNKTSMTSPADENNDPNSGHMYVNHRGDELHQSSGIATINSWNYHLEDKVIFEAWRSVTPNLVFDPGGLVISIR